MFDEEKVTELVALVNDMLIEADKGINARASFDSYPSRKGGVLVTPDPYKGVKIRHTV